MLNFLNSYLRASITAVIKDDDPSDESRLFWSGFCAQVSILRSLYPPVHFRSVTTTALANTKKNTKKHKTRPDNCNGPCRAVLLFFGTKLGTANGEIGAAFRSVLARNGNGRKMGRFAAVP